MSEYIVSARKYRPDSFETLIGQDNIAQTLKNSILRGQLAHAYLFCGPRGVGKTSTARIFAKTINCMHPTANMEPCGECESCVSFAEGRSYCIYELDAASNNSVEDIKTLMEKVQIPPQVGNYSVYIIDEVHMLSQAAFNAFLKTLEEPPSYAIFILCTTEKHKVLPTILSRCQTYDFNRIGISDMVRNLRTIADKEGVKIDDESLHIIARKADGAMRDALTIFDQTVAFCGTDVKYADVVRNLGVLDYDYSFDLVEFFLTKDYASALLKFDTILSRGFNALHFISALGDHLRNLLVARTGGLESLLDLPDSLKERYREQASRCSVKFLYDAIGIVTSCEAGYKASTNQRLHIEYALMRLSFLGGVPESSVAQGPASLAPAQPAATSASSASATGTAPGPAGAGPAAAPAAQQGAGPAVAASAAPAGKEGLAAKALKDSEISNSLPLKNKGETSIQNIDNQSVERHDDDVIELLDLEDVDTIASSVSAAAPAASAENAASAAGTAVPAENAQVVAAEASPAAEAEAAPVGRKRSTRAKSVMNSLLAGEEISAAASPASAGNTAVTAPAGNKSAGKAVPAAEASPAAPSEAASAPSGTANADSGKAAVSPQTGGTADASVVTAAAPAETVPAEPVPEPLPSDEEILAHWPELIKACSAGKPRLENALSKAKLSLSEEDGFKNLSFEVVNEAQKQWIEKSILRNMENTFAGILKNGKVHLFVSVEPVDDSVRKVYLPAEKAQELMNTNPEVRGLISDLGLDAN